MSNFQFSTQSAKGKMPFKKENTSQSTIPHKISVTQKRIPEPNEITFKQNANVLQDNRGLNEPKKSIPNLKSQDASPMRSGFASQKASIASKGDSRKYHQKIQDYLNVGKPSLNTSSATHATNEPGSMSSQGCKYEQMAQQLSLESLIKQAQRRNLQSGKTTGNIQSAFMNKISNFEGDNDHVDDELESSGEKERSFDLEVSCQIEAMDPKKESYLQPFRAKTGRLQSYSNLDAKVGTINAHQFGKPSPFHQASNQDQKQKLCSYTEKELLQYQSNKSKLDELKQQYLSRKSEFMSKYTGSSEKKPSHPPQVMPSKKAMSPFQINFEAPNPNFSNLEEDVTPQKEEEEGQKEDEPVQEYNDTVLEEDHFEMQEQIQDKVIINKESMILEEQEEIQEVEEEEEEQSPAQSKILPPSSDSLPQEQTPHQHIQFLPQQQQQQEEEEQSPVQEESDQPLEVKVQQKEEQTVESESFYQNSPTQAKESARVEQRFLNFDDFISRQSIQVVVEEEKKQEQKKQLSVEEKKQLSVEEAKLQISRKEREKEQKKKSDIEMLKMRAKERENYRIKRLNAALMIQKCVRGFLKRKQFRELQKNFKYMRKLRRMVSVAYGRARTRIIKQVAFALRDYAEKNRSEQEVLMKQYIEHCTVMIQKSWRGYSERRWRIPAVTRLYFAQRNVLRLVQGWKTRKIMAECREVVNAKRGIAELEGMMRQSIKVNDQRLNMIRIQRRKKVEELIRVFPNLYKKGRWIYSLQKKLISSKSQKQTDSAKKNYQHSSQAGFNYGINVEFSNNNYKQKMISPSKSNFSPPQELRELEAPRQHWNEASISSVHPEEQKIGVLWPSRKANNDIQETSMNSSRQMSEGQFIRAPPQALQKQRPSEFFQPIKSNNGQASMQLSVEESKVLSSNSKVGPSPQKSPYVSKRFEEDEGSFNFESRLRVNKQESPQEHSSSMERHHDLPLQISKKNPTFKEQDIENQEIKPRFPVKQAQSYMSNQTIDDQEISPSKIQYDFEKMIELALQEQGQPPADNSKKRNSNLKRAKTAREQSDEDEEGNPDKNEKKQNLKRRQKYDPRKAIQDAKKKEDDKPHKSAFPQGMLKSKQDRVRSTTQQPRTLEEDELEEEKQMGKSPMNRESKRQKESAQQNQPAQEYNDNQMDNQSELTGLESKPYLKRKSKQVLKFEKCSWNVKSRINCWTKGDNKSQVREQQRQKSWIRSPKDSIPQQTTKTQQKEGGMQKQAKTPRNRKSDVSEVVSMQNQKRVNKKQEQSQDLFRSHRIDDDLKHSQMEAVPMENEIGRGEESVHTYKLNLADLIGGQQTFSDHVRGGGDSRMETGDMPSFENKNLLHLEELERLYAMFHGTPQVFERSVITETSADTCIPHMSLQSLFFQCYSDEIYDSILDDFREDYFRLCNES